MIHCISTRAHTCCIMIVIPWFLGPLQIPKPSGAQQWCNIRIKPRHALLQALNGLEVMGGTSYSAVAVPVVVMPYFSENNDKRKLCTCSVNAFFKFLNLCFFPQPYINIHTFLVLRYDYSAMIKFTFWARPLI